MPGRWACPVVLSIHDRFRVGKETPIGIAVDREMQLEPDDTRPAHARPAVPPDRELIRSGIEVEVRGHDLDGRQRNYEWRAPAFEPSPWLHRRWGSHPSAKSSHGGYTGPRRLDDGFRSTTGVGIPVQRKKRRRVPDTRGDGIGPRPQPRAPVLVSTRAM